MKRLAALIIMLLFLSSAVSVSAYDVSSKVSVTISPNSELLSAIIWLLEETIPSS